MFLRLPEIDLASEIELAKKRACDNRFKKESERRFFESVQDKTMGELTPGEAVRFIEIVAERTARHKTPIINNIKTTIF